MHKHNLDSSHQFSDEKFEQAYVDHFRNGQPLNPPEAAMFKAAMEFGRTGNIGLLDKMDNEPKIN